MHELERKRVLIVGAGGLGSPVALLLARAGVGELTLLDDDQVEASNLHRQVLYSTDDVGAPKVQRARERLQRELRAAGSPTRVVARPLRLVPELAANAVRDFDLVVEGADNFATKFLAADACALSGVTCVQGGAVGFTGWAFASVPGKSACLRCVFEDIPHGRADTCAQAGVVGPLVGVLGALQAALSLRLLRGEHGAAGVLHHVLALRGGLRAVRVSRAGGCPLCTGAIRDLDARRYLPREHAA